MAAEYTGTTDELTDILGCWDVHERLQAWRDAAVARSLAEAGAVNSASKLFGERNRALAKHDEAVARVAELEGKQETLEAELATERAHIAALTEETEYGRPGFQWSMDHHGTVDGRPAGDSVPMSEREARTRVASLRAAGVLPNPVLLRRPHGAWERWPLDEQEADEMAAKERDGD